MPWKCSCQCVIVRHRYLTAAIVDQWSVSCHLVIFRPLAVQTIDRPLTDHWSVEPLMTIIDESPYQWFIHAWSSMVISEVIDHFSLVARIISSHTLYTCTSTRNIHDYQSVKLHNAITFQMLHCVITFDEIWQNLPTLIIFYKVIRGTKILHIKTFGTRNKIWHFLVFPILYSF